MRKRMWRTGLVLAAAVVAACDEDPVQQRVEPQVDVVSVALSPSTVTLGPGAEQMFEAVVANAANPGVSWSTTGGELSFVRAGSGDPERVVYTAPDTAGTFLVRATSVADPAASDSAVVTVRLTPVVSIEPATAVLAPGESRTFEAHVANTTNTDVRWSATDGAITGSGSTITFEAPLSLGTVYLTATSLADTTQSATAAISVITGVVEVRGSLTADASWESDRTYIVVDDVVVPGGVTLSIGPGTVVKFFRPEAAPNTPRYEIRIEGTLAANGTATAPVVFTSLHDDTAGGDTNADGNATVPAVRDWEAVRFANGSTGTLDHVTARYGGGVSGSLSQTVGTFYVDGGDVRFDGVRVEHAAWSAISAGPNDHPVVTNFSAGDVPLGGLEIRAGDIAGTALWDQRDIVTILTGNVHVPSASTLIVEAGIVVKALPSAAGDFFRPRLHVGGHLDVRGTDAEPVVFTSLHDDAAGGDTGDDGATGTPRPRDWEGIRIDGGNASLTHVDVRYAGGASGSPSDNVGAIVIRDAAPVMSNVTVRHAAWSAVSMGPSDAPLVTGLVTEDVPIAGIEVRSETMTSDATWGGGDVPFVLTGSITVPASRTLRIGEGSVVKVLRPSPTSDSPRYALDVAGTLDITGTGPAPVVLTSLADDTAGGDTNGDGSGSEPAVRDWAGIRFSGGDGTLAHVEVRYAGGVSGSATETDGAIRLEDSSPTFEDVAVRDGAWSAISAGPGDHPSVSGLSSVRTPIGGIEIRGETLMLDAMWDQVGVAYVLTGDVTVPSTETLRIGPGVIVKFHRPSESGDSVRHRLIVLGRLDVEGTADARVTFTSHKDDAAGGDTNGDGATTVPTVRDWQSIEFIGGTGSISFADIRFGGAQSGTFSGNRGAVHAVDSSPSLVMCSLRTNTYGIQADGVTAAPVVVNSNITTNTLFGAIATNGAVVTATDNWWGSVDGPGGEGGGNGDPVTTNVSVIPFLSAPAF